MEGHQRAIMGNMTVEEIYRDRKTFSTKVFEVTPVHPKAASGPPGPQVASVDLHALGIMVISYTIKVSRIPGTWLHVLGVMISGVAWWYHGTS